MRLQYLLGQALANLRRNVLVVFAAVVAVLVMLTLVFGTIVLRWSIDQDIGRWDDNVRVIAFLSDDLTSPIAKDWSIGLERQLPANMRLQLSFREVRRSHRHAGDQNCRSNEPRRYSGNHQ